MRKSFEQTGSDVGAFGERLRREREMRGITLDDIAAGTKIGTRLLRALEEEQFDLLPGGIFNKGYVRAYARYIGVDEEKAVAEYLSAVNRAHVDDQSSSLRSDAVRRGMTEATHGSGFPLIPVLILLVVILGAAGAWHLYQQRQREGVRSSKAQRVVAPQPSSPDNIASSSSGGSPALEQTRPTTESSAKTASSAPSRSGETNAAVRTVEAADGSLHPAGSGAPAPPASTGGVGSDGASPFEVTVRAKDRARVEIKSDGKVLVSGVMNPSDVRTIHASSKVVFWTGNAGEVELSFNGKNVPLNGGENDEQVLVFNSHGLMPRPATQ
jgi:cytoskeleton protein RodZ